MKDPVLRIIGAIVRAALAHPVQAAVIGAVAHSIRKGVRQRRQRAAQQAKCEVGDADTVADETLQDAAEPETDDPVEERIRAAAAQQQVGRRTI